MPIDKIEQLYIKNRTSGLYQLQQNDYLLQLEEIDDAIIAAFEKEDYEEVILRLDELCYLFIQGEDTKVVFIALETYYISLVTMILRSMIRKKNATEEHLSNATAIIAIVKQWKDIKDYLYFTPWFVTKVRELFEENAKTINMNSYIHNAILIIQKELFNPNLTTSYIADQLDISKGYFCYLFKQEYGESLTTMINKMRLKHALTDIKEAKIPLVKVVEKYGFKSYPYFCRIFKAQYGVSPLQYRKECFFL